MFYYVLQNFWQWRGSQGVDQEFSKKGPSHGVWGKKPPPASQMLKQHVKLVYNFNVSCTKLII